MPEFDVPGHSASWGDGYPELIVDCPEWDANINNIPLDPTKDFTYEVLQVTRQFIYGNGIFRDFWARWLDSLQRILCI